MRVFKIGDRVKMNAYRDCFGKDHDELRNLVVTEFTGDFQEPVPYHRLMAESQDVNPYVRSIEGAERFFALDTQVSAA